MKGYSDPLKQFIKMLIKNIYYFEQISNDSLEELANYMKQNYFDCDQVLFRAGDPVEDIYFIASGTVNIIVELEHNQIILETLSEGCVIGFNGILSKNLFTFTARAKSKVSVYTLSKDKLKLIQNLCEDIFKSVTKARTYFKKESLPYIDFCIPQIQEKEEVEKKEEK